VNESGAAFDDVSSIIAQYQKPTFEKFKPKIFKELGLTDDDWRPLGSTFKRKKDTASGDLDFAVNGLAVGAKFKIGFEDVLDKIEEVADKVFPKYKSSKNIGLGVICIKFPQYDEKGKETDLFVQIDLMVVDDLDLAEFVYHSPDFSKNESKYKGLFRNSLIHAILNHIDIEDNEEYYQDEYEGKYSGMVKAFKKYSLTAGDGLKMQTKSYEGKKGRKKNAAIVREHDKLISKNVDEITKLILGPDATKIDINSVESIWDYMFTDKFAHKHNRDKIIETYIEFLSRRGFPIPEEVKEYVK